MHAGLLRRFTPHMHSEEHRAEGRQSKQPNGTDLGAISDATSPGHSPLRLMPLVRVRVHRDHRRAFAVVVCATMGRQYRGREFYVWTFTSSAILVSIWG